LDKHFTGQAPVKWSSNFTGQADYPDEIEENRFHGAGTDTNECAVEISKSAGFNSPQLAAGKFIYLYILNEGMIELPPLRYAGFEIGHIGLILRCFAMSA